MTTPYTPEFRERDARLAVAMGWRRVHLTRLNIEQAVIVPPDWQDTKENQQEFWGVDLWRPGSMACRLVPKFHASHDAKHALLTWLAADEGRWNKFLHELTPENGTDCLNCFMPDPKVLMLASPEAVAIAADEALRQAGVYGEVEK